MSKFDLFEKLNLTDLMKGLLDSDRVSPYFFLKKVLNLSDSWQENYFNWGRNAFYYLFKSLRFKSITFPAFTCPTLTDAAQKAGKKVILSEVDLDTFNLDINKIPKNTECLVVVHTFGNPVDIEAIRDKFKKIFIIEDCAHALFSKINGEFVGNRGDAILFSLYKQIPNINGALLLTKKEISQQQDQENILKYLRRLIYKIRGPHQLYLNYKRTQYLPTIEPQELNNNRQSNLVNNLFISGVKRLGQEIASRRRVSSWYIQNTNNSPFIIHQKPTIDGLPSCYQFAVRVKPNLATLREKIVRELRKKQIFVDRLWYQAPITLKQYQSFQKKCPKALILAKTIINLPIYSWYTKKDVKYLFDQLNTIINKCNN